MNSHVGARIPVIACAVAVAAWCVFVFRGAWIDLARADHLALLEERLFFDTRAAYAWHLLGYQRTRILSGEDLVLSRPLLDAWHAVLEGLLEVDGRERGLLGIAVHALTVLAVFRFALRWLPLGLSALAGLAVASPFPGMDLVVWRHATPYGLAVCFLTMAAAELSERAPSRAKVFAWLTLSALAHETMVAVLVVAAAARVALPAERKRTWAWWTVGPIAVWAIVYAFEAFVFPLRWEIGASRGATLTGLAWMPRVLGLAAFAWAAPGTFGVAFDPWARAIVSSDAEPIAAMAGGLLLVAMIAGLVAALWVFVRDDRPAANVALLVGGYLVTGVALLCLGRLGTRGPGYLASSGYYFQIWAVCLEVLAVLAVGARLREAKAPLAVASFVIVSLSAASSVLFVRPLLDRQRDFARAVHELDRAIVAALDERPGWCFAGVTDDGARRFFAPATPFAPLGRRVCSVAPARHPVVLSVLDGRLALVPMLIPPVGPGEGPSGLVSVRVERGTGVILQVVGDSTVAVAYVGHELHVARDGRELVDQTDVVPVADASGAHTLALAVVAGRVRALFDGMLEGDIGPASVLDGTPSVLGMDDAPKTIGPILRSSEAPRLAIERAVVLDVTLR